MSTSSDTKPDWLGLTPRESSTGARRYLGRISKRGDVHLRCRGHAHRHRGHAATVAVYQGERGERLVCEMYAARPPSRTPIERRTHNGVVFTVYREGDVTMVFWDEGPVTCVLVSTIDPEALVQLAFAKAVRKS